MLNIIRPDQIKIFEVGKTQEAKMYANVTATIIAKLCIATSVFTHHLGFSSMTLKMNSAVIIAAKGYVT